MKKVKCLHCEHEFVAQPEEDSFGWHCTCPVCKGSFDVDYEKVVKTSNERLILELALTIANCIVAFESMADGYAPFTENWKSSLEMADFTESLIDEWINSKSEQKHLTGFVMQRLHEMQAEFQSR